MRAKFLHFIKLHLHGGTAGTNETRQNEKPKKKKPVDSIRWTLTSIRVRRARQPY